MADSIIGGELLLVTIHELGGVAHLSHIYTLAEKKWNKTGKPMPLNFEPEIRATLQYHCLESKRLPKGEIFFRMAKERGRGWWALAKPLPDLPSL